MLTKLRVTFLLPGLLALSACGGSKYVAPQAPTGLTATPEAGKIVLKWQDNSDNEIGYTVFRKEASGAAGASGLTTLAEDGFSELASLPENSERYEDTSVKAGVKYRYAVQAEGQEGSSSPPFDSPTAFARHLS